MTATKQIQDSWFAGAIGRAMNPDNAYGLQCKDVADDYAVSLFGNWTNTVKPGNGKDVFNNANPDFFIKVANNPNDPNQIPPHGAIINWGASRAVPEGHVAVVDSATANNVTVIQQDGYIQYPARRVTLGYQLPNGAMCIGWLIPRLAPETPMVNRDQLSQAFRDILERDADPGAFDHYVGKYTYDFILTDLKNSAEYRDLQNRKAAAAQAAADEAVRQAALQAEANRLAEERAALDALEAKKRAEEEAAAQAAKPPVVVVSDVSDPFDVPSPVTIPSTQPTTPTKPQNTKSLVRLLFEVFLNIFKKK